MKQLPLTNDLYDYLLSISLREDPVLTALREKTASMPLARMQVAPDEAQFMQFLLKLMHAKLVLEVGTFTGYSALAMALALPDEGKVITCDINREWTDIAKPYWQEAGQDHKIDLRLAPALETLHVLLNDGMQENFDFIFIDADKTNELRYYELALKLITRNGLIMIDNTLWGGRVIDESEQGAQTRQIRRLNAFIAQDQRVDVSVLAVSDGLTLVKRS